MSLEVKCLLRGEREMSFKITKFNAEDKRNLVMEGEVIFQDAKVEYSKVDGAI